MNTPGSNLDCGKSETKSIKSLGSNLKSGLSGAVKEVYKSPFKSELEERVNNLESKMKSMEERYDIIVKLLNNALKEDN